MSMPRKKKRKNPAGGGTSMELQKMLSANYGRKGQKIMLGQ